MSTNSPTMVFDVTVEQEELSNGEKIYVASCHQVDIASQGVTVEEAKANLAEALTGLKQPLKANWRTASRSFGGTFQTFTSRELRFPMGKLRVLSGAEVYEILKSQGFQRDRQSGNHVSMQKKLQGTTITVPVPLHRELAIGTLNKIIRQSGLPKVFLKFNNQLSFVTQL